ncbi:Panacea domain-containing protein, partial [Pseudomonas aeruginosa]
IDFNLEAFSPEQVELLNEVQQIYGQYSAWRLREMTHEEAPWRNNYQAGAMSREIPTDDMRQFFKTLVK